VTGVTMLETMQRVEAVEGRLVEVGAAVERLGRARSQLQRSLATAAVLSAAAGEGAQLVARLRGTFPRK
jgi:hypothetical protein